MAGKYSVTGDLYREIHRRTREIFRQLDQKSGSPLDPEWVANQLQRIVEFQPIVLPVPITCDVSDPVRINQATILYGAFGKELCLDFNTYLATIPKVPTFPDDYAERFGQIILVDTRLPITKQCQLLGVQFGGNDETFVDYDPTKRPSQPVYWMSCQDGKRNLKKKVRVCRQQFQLDEVGSTVHEGLAIFAQNRQILQDHCLDFPGSVLRGSRGHAAFLFLDEDKPCLGCRWGDDEGPEYGSVSRGSVIS